MTATTESMTSMKTNTESSAKVSAQPALGSRAEQREKTRALILQSVLDIIVSDGMRAVRHRAVAKRAEIALGTTTYHFSSIEDLIFSAFQFWSSRHKLQDNPYYQKIDEQLKPYENSVVGSDERSLIAERIYQISVNYVCDQLTGKREDRMVELAFYHESLGSALIKDMVLTRWNFEVGYMESVFKILGSNRSLDDARITLSLFRQLEQTAIIANLERLDKDVIRTTLHRHICLSLGITFPM